jgi:hypothetical protein
VRLLRKVYYLNTSLGSALCRITRVYTRVTTPKSGWSHEGSSVLNTHLTHPTSTPLSTCGGPSKGSYTNSTLNLTLLETQKRSGNDFVRP